MGEESVSTIIMNVNMHTVVVTHALASKKKKIRCIYPFISSQ